MRPAPSPLRSAFCALLLILAVGGAMPFPLTAGETLSLWPVDSVPGLRHARPEELRAPKRANSEPERSYWYVSTPSLTLFLLEETKESRPAVLVLPGGGYRQIVWDKEGVEIARWLNRLGFQAAVLKYRTFDPDQERTREVYDSALADAEQAMRLLRSRAGEWHIDPARVGAMGFSAGAHLALRLAAAASPEAPMAAAPLTDLSTRPDLLVLIYGAHPLRNAEALGPGFPPVFIAHAADDPKVPVGGAIDFFSQLHKAGGSAELHVFGRGDHGFALRDPEIAESWTALFQAWAMRNGF